MNLLVSQKPMLVKYFSIFAKSQPNVSYKNVSYKKKSKNNKIPGLLPGIYSLIFSSYLYCTAGFFESVRPKGCTYLTL